jgi:hypothetical protein
VDGIVQTQKVIQWSSILSIAAFPILSGSPKSVAWAESYQNNTWKLALCPSLLWLR